MGAVKRTHPKARQRQMEDKYIRRNPKTFITATTLLCRNFDKLRRELVKSFLPAIKRLHDFFIGIDFGNGSDMTAITGINTNNETPEEKEELPEINIRASLINADLITSLHHPIFSNQNVKFASHREHECLHCRKENMCSAFMNDSMPCPKSKRLPEDAK